MTHSPLPLIPCALYWVACGGAAQQRPPRPVPVAATQPASRPVAPAHAKPLVTLEPFTFLPPHQRWASAEYPRDVQLDMKALAPSMKGPLQAPWRRYVALLDRLERLTQQRAALPKDDVEAYKRHGVRSDRLGKAIGRLERRLLALLQRAVGRPRPAPELLLVYGYLRRWPAEDEHGRLEEAGKDPSGVWKPVIEALERAKAASSPNSDTGWLARFYLAQALERIHSKRAAEEYRALGKLPRRKGTAEVWYRLACEEFDAKRAVQAYRRAIQAAEQGSVAECSSRYNLVYTYRSRAQWKEVLVEAIALAERCKSVRQEGIWNAVLSVEMLGGTRKSGLEAGPRLRGQVGLRVAKRALDRRDLPAAIASWEAVLDSSPGTAEADEALAWLVAAHERRGDKGRADALRPRLKPAVKVRLELPAPPTSDEAVARGLRGRLFRLLRYCATLPITIHTKHALEVEVEAFDRQAARLTLLPSFNEPYLRCLRERGPSFFVDAPASLRVKVTVDPNG